MGSKDLGNWHTKVPIKKAYLRKVAHILTQHCDCKIFAAVFLKFGPRKGTVSCSVPLKKLLLKLPCT